MSNGGRAYVVVCLPLLPRDERTGRISERDQKQERFPVSPDRHNSCTPMCDETRVERRLPEGARRWRLDAWSDERTQELLLLLLQVDIIRSRRTSTDRTESSSHRSRWLPKVRRSSQLPGRLRSCGCRRRVPRAERSAAERQPNNRKFISYISKLQHCCIQLKILTASATCQRHVAVERSKHNKWILTLLSGWFSGCNPGATRVLIQCQQTFTLQVMSKTNLADYFTSVSATVDCV